MVQSVHSNPHPLSLSISHTHTPWVWEGTISYQNIKQGWPHVQPFNLDPHNIYLHHSSHSQTHTYCTHSLTELHCHTFYSKSQPVYPTTTTTYPPSLPAIQSRAKPLIPKSEKTHNDDCSICRGLCAPITPPDTQPHTLTLTA